MVTWIINRWLSCKLTNLLKSHNVGAIKAWAAKINAALTAMIQAADDDEITSDEVNAVVEALTHA